MAELRRFSTRPAPREQQFPMAQIVSRHYFGDVRATAQQAPGSTHGSNPSQKEASS